MPFAFPEYHAPDFKSEKFASAPDVKTAAVAKDGVAPENFHSTSIYPEYFKIGGRWKIAEDSRMDCSVVIRPDGKLDVGLQPFGRRLKEDFAEQLLEYLNSHDGQCHLSDNSSPEDIKELFHVSKKTFKRAVGDLYKRRLIIIEANGIRLTK